MRILLFWGSIISIFTLVGCSFNSTPAEKKEKPYIIDKKKNFDALSSSRCAKWEYSADITKKEADKYAAHLKSLGVTHVLTEGHRYIMYDLKDENNPFEFIFTPQPREKSIEATRIVADALHAKNMYCLNHITSTYASKDLMQQHRDWTQRDARNPEEPLFFDMYGGVYIFCLNNPEFRAEFINKVIEISKRAHIDGWMIDEVEWLPTWYSCGCEHCRELFTKETGYRLPVGQSSPVWENYENPIWRAWLRWRMKSAGDFFVELKSKLDAEVPGMILTACHAGASSTWLAQKWGMDIIELKRGLNWIFYEAYINNGMNFYNWRRYLGELKLYAAVARDTNISPLALFYPNFPKEGEFTCAISALSGFRIWYGCSKKEKIEDGRNFFRWQEKNEKLFDNKEPFTNTALLFSKQTRDNYAGDDTRLYSDEWGGWAEILNQERIPHEVILESDLNDEYIKKFETIIIPHAVCLSDSQIKSLAAYQSSGGKLIISGETGMRDETGQLRTDISILDTLIAKSIYVPGKPGVDSELNYFRAKKMMEDKRDPLAVKKILEAVNICQKSGKNTYYAEAPEGVIVSAYILKDNSIAVHLLNATGAVIENLKVPENKKDYSVRFPSVENIRITIPKKKDMLKFKYAYDYQFNQSEPDEISLVENEDSYTITLPSLDKYSVIHLTGRKIKAE